MAAWIDDKALGRKYSGRQLIFSWLGGKQRRAPSICSTLYRNPRRSLCWKYLAAHICAGEATSQRWVAQFAQFRSAQACRVHRRDEAPHTGRKQHPNPPKAALKQRLNPFMWGLFLCPEWRMHVWATTVSECWYKGRKPAASKHESKKKKEEKLATWLKTAGIRGAFSLLWGAGLHPNVHTCRRCDHGGDGGSRTISLKWAASCVESYIQSVHSKLHCKNKKKTNKEQNNIKFAVCRFVRC